MTWKTRKVKSSDGTTIIYDRLDQNLKRKTRPLWVLCNGLGGTRATWNALIEGLSKSLNPAPDFLHWDYRGLFRSHAPADIEHLAIDDHLADLSAILSKEGAQKVSLVGWSMGVQVALEFYARFPQLVSTLVLINGTYGSPFNAALKNPLSRYVLPTVTRLASWVLPALQPSLVPVARRVIQSEQLLDWAISIGLAHSSLDRAVFREVAEGIMECDLNIYHRILGHLNDHNAAEVLPKIRVPTLIIAGEKDIFTPASEAEKMAEKIPGAQFFSLPQATHYALLEFPDLLMDRISRFVGDE
jgi:pimeloyl-ACP methyl ester carboxylesterase